MTRFTIALSLSITGPRQRLLEQEFWPLALRVAVGIDGAHDTPAARQALVAASLPWTVFSSESLSLRIESLDGVESIVSTVVPAKGQDVSFVERLRTDVRDRALDLAAKDLLTYTFGGQQEDVEAGESDPQVSWPGLMQSLTSLPPVLASQLRATWFLLVPRRHFAELRDDRWQERVGATVSVVPAAISGIGWERTENGDVPNSVVAHYGAEGDELSAIAYANVLQTGQLADSDPPELADYWLEIRDARQESLLGVAQQVELALRPSAILAEIALDEFQEALRVEEEGANGATIIRRARPDEAEKAYQGMLQASRELNAVAEGDLDSAFNSELRAIRTELMAEALNDGRPFQSALPAALPSAFVKSLNGCPPPTGYVLNNQMLADYSAPRARIEAGISPLRPCLPGEGIELALGQEARRMLHQDRPGNDAIDEIAAVQLFGRRASRESDLVGESWSTFCAARLAFDYNADEGAARALSEPQLFGVSATYIDGVLYREVQYLGMNLIAKSTLQRAHRQTIEPEVGHAQSFLLAEPDRVPLRDTDGLPGALSIPLRYGDFYEFAAAVQDRTGGMATELAIEASPWLLDWNRIPDLRPPRSDTMRFLRRVAVGDCNIVPSMRNGRREWPETPADVWLRCREQSPDFADADTAPAPGSRPSVVLLVPTGAGFQDPGLPHYTFEFSPPAIDEHTLLRWGLPETHASDESRRTAIAELRAQLTDIYEKRDELLITPQEPGTTPPPIDLPPDPAVAAIGLRIHLPDGGQTLQHVLRSKGDMHLAYRDGRADFDTNTNTLTLPKGEYAILEFYPLVDRATFDQRFDRDALESLLATDVEFASGETSFVAFQASTVLVEVADDTMPPLVADHLTVNAAPTRNVELFLSTGLETAMQNVHQFTVSSERWTWRNHPLVPPGWMPRGHVEEDRRRLASGPTPVLFHRNQRDNAQLPDQSDDVVHALDLIAAIDRGFISRPPVTQRLPRRRSADVPLYVDGRDGVSHSDYLRYWISLRSRYAGVLKHSEVRTTEPRRIAVPFRGDETRIKPPRVLTILPLTKQLDADPRGPQPADAGTPFLVILDESWFREYGIGERLEASIVHVKEEIGDRAEDEKPLLYGPLPDHYTLAPTISDARKAELLRPLDCFGPFGLSLDRSGNEALANATGWVIFAPPGTPPHYNLFVRFRRILEIGEEDRRIVSPPTDQPKESDVWPLYTLRSNDDLNPTGTLRLTKEGTGLRFPPDALALSPLRGADPEVLRQYRYVLVVGRSVRDGGRGVELFLPAGALWLRGSSAEWIEKEAPRGFPDGQWEGQILEILTNGRYPFDPTRPEGHPDNIPTSRIDTADSLKELFRRMLDATNSLKVEPGKELVRDAPGMIRRISGRFDLQVS